MRRFYAQPASDDTYRVAEGPVWDPVRARLLWVDIEAGAVLDGELVDGRVVPMDRRTFGQTVGAAVRALDGRVLVASHRHLVVTSPAGEVIGSWDDVGVPRGSRFNDGACDPAGRFLIGSMALDGRRGEDCLWRLEDDGSLRVLDRDLTTSNGLAWSPDGNLLYSVDSHAGVVWSRAYDVASGEVGERQELMAITDGAPDGMCTDVDGNLWIAIFGAREVGCYSPAGEQLATIQVATPNPTSVAFVGPDLDSLVITTGRHDLSPVLKAEFPDSGRLFLADVGVRGLPVAMWSGVHPQRPGDW